MWRNWPDCKNLLISSIEPLEFSGMSVQPPPKPNTQALSWFYGEEKKGALRLNPKYQRNPIWSIGQKCFLIDSIISGTPLPQVYINIKTEGSGRDRKTVYEVVDGQQRLRAILEFMNDEWPLIETTAKSYPVSDIYKPHIGAKYSELPSSYQDAIWNYPLAVQELRGWDERQIRDLFRRLNYVVEKLNPQELRHSQYFGEFVDTVEKLAADPFWDEIDLFSRRDSQRMKDIEFVSELFVVVVDGIQDQQRSLDKFYADYDVLFPKKAYYVSKFHQIIDSLKTLGDLTKKSRLSNRTDFYSLFAAVAHLNEKQRTPQDLSPAVKALEKFVQQMDKDPDALKGRAAQYHATIIEGPNKFAKRTERTSLLEEIIRDCIV